MTLVRIRLTFLVSFCCFSLSSLLALAQGNDPLALFVSTYLGGGQEDSIRDIAVDSQGNIYVTGGTASADFPVTSGSHDVTYNGVHDVFVAKLSTSGKLVWSTFLGGPNYDRAYAIEVDLQGYVYVAGRASSGFPTTPGVLQRNFGDDVNPNSRYGQQDGFISKLSPDGTQLVWSTYFGGNGRDFVRDIDVDSGGSVYAAVSEVDRAHPHITSGAFQPTLKGAFDGVIARISADATSVLFATYFGGSTDDGFTPSIRIDDSGNAHFLTLSRADDAPTTSNAFQKRRKGNWDMVLAKLSPTGSLIYSTYFGGSDTEFTETHGLAVDGSGNAFICATTKSSDLPTTQSAYQTSYGGGGGSGTGTGTNYSGDGFIAKISSDGSTLLSSTYLGGADGEGLEGAAVDANGNIYVSGATYSSNFPVTKDDVFQSNNRGKADFFAVRLSANLDQLLYSTYLGGGSLDYGRTATVDNNGNFYVAGMSESNNLTTRNAMQTSRAGGYDGAFAKFIPNTSTPVELISFAAQAVENTIRLEWQTASESNNLGFSVERSLNQREYMELAFRKGHGSVNERSLYSYVDENVPLGRHSYRLKQIDLNGSFEYHGPVEVMVHPPANPVLLQNFPNPFNARTDIRFRLKGSGHVKLTIVDLLGHEIVTLVDSMESAGDHRVQWDATDAASGIYLYRLQADGFSQSRKLLLIK